jgi:ATP-dependent DNA helicase RecG
MGENATKITKETVILEAKRAGGDKLPLSMWETYSSFCNTLGGRILLGVEEDPKTHELRAVGLEDSEKFIRDIWDTVNNPLRVSYVALKDRDVRVEEMDGREIIVIDVPTVDRHNRPVFINGNINSGTFRRNHDGDYHCNLAEIKEMIRDSESRTSDSSVSERSDMSCINQESLNGYRNALKAFKGNHPWLGLPDEEFTELIGASGLGVDGLVHPTNAGLLMFGKEHCITSQFPDYFLDYRELGPERWSYRIQSQSGEWSGNVFDFFTVVSGRLATLVKSPFELEGIVRKGESEAFKAAREAVMNALIHSDYNVRMGVSVVLEGDRVTISNPGTFRVPVSKAVKGGSSDPRNGQIMKMFSLIGLVERAGTGLYTIIESERIGAIADVRIEESFDPSRITVILDMSSEGPQDDKTSDILRIISDNGELTIAQIALRAGISEKTVSRILSEQKAIGNVERIGSKKTGQWKVNNR